MNVTISSKKANVQSPLLCPHLLYGHLDLMLRWHCLNRTCDSLLVARIVARGPSRAGSGTVTGRNGTQSDGQRERQAFGEFLLPEWLMLPGCSPMFEMGRSGRIMPGQEAAHKSRCEESRVVDSRFQGLTRPRRIMSGHGRRREIRREIKALVETRRGCSPKGFWSTQGKVPSCLPGPLANILEFILTRFGHSIYIGIKSDILLALLCLLIKQSGESESGSADCDR